MSTQACIIICTHNRASILERSVSAALAQAVSCDAEVIVVDNASTDGTPAVLAALRERSAALRLLYEAELGLSAARNRGLAEAHGDIAIFLDDDAVPRSGWLRALLQPFEARRVACAGGKIVVQFPDQAPAWYRVELQAAVSGFDLGDHGRCVRYGRPGDVYPYGANIAFRIGDARHVGGFSTLVGLRGAQLTAHEETDLCYRLEAAGREIHYVPDAVVDHHVAAERLTPEWFLVRHQAGGRSAATFVLRNRGVLRALWRLRWLYGRPLFARPYTPHGQVDPERFVKECRRREALGYLSGLVEGIPRYRALREGRPVLPPQAGATRRTAEV